MALIFYVFNAVFRLGTSFRKMMHFIATETSFAECWAKFPTIFVFFAAKFTTDNFALSIISAHVISWYYSSNFIDISINVLFIFLFLFFKFSCSFFICFICIFTCSKLLQKSIAWAKVNLSSRNNRARRLSPYIPSTIRSRIKSCFKLPNSQVATKCLNAVTYSSIVS